MADNVEIEKPSEPKDKKALLDKIQGVLEELLSKENVSEDVFIQQHMNAQMFIPLCILGGHRDIAELGPEVDVATLMTAAQQSEKLSVDEGQLLVRPVIRARRNTLILHDLPNEISQAALTEELQELFASSPEGEALTSVKPDVNRTAFVAFETDEAAQNAALWLRSQKLRGAAIKCAVKSEHFLRSFFPATPGVPAPVVTAEASAGASTSPPQVMMGWSQQWGAQQWPSGMGYDATSAEMGWTVGGAWAQGSEDGFFKGKGKGKINGKGKGKGKGKFKGKGPPSPEMGQMDAVPRGSVSSEAFGPLQEEPAMGAEGDDYDLIGYTHEFRRYTRQKIIDVCSSMEEVTMPESFARIQEEQDVGLFRQSPCKDWAPLPTPLLSFAASVFSGERKERSASGEQGGDAGEGSPNMGPRTRKGSSAWTRSSRSQSDANTSDEQPTSYAATEDTQWTEAEWAEWTAEADARWRKRASTWGGEAHGQSKWVEKSQVDQKPSWAEKVKGMAGGSAPARWQPKPKDEKEEGPVTAAEGAAVAAAVRTESGEAPSQSTSTWADKVRSGK